MTDERDDGPDPDARRDQEIDRRMEDQAKSRARAELYALCTDVRRFERTTQMNVRVYEARSLLSRMVEKARFFIEAHDELRHELEGALREQQALTQHYIRRGDAIQVQLNACREQQHYQRGERPDGGGGT